jgi:hypothetical protein
MHTVSHAPEQDQKQQDLREFAKQQDLREFATAGPWRSLEAAWANSKYIKGNKERASN